MVGWPKKRMGRARHLVRSSQRSGVPASYLSRWRHKLRDAGFAVIVNDAFPEADTEKSTEIDMLTRMDYEVLYLAPIGVDVPGATALLPGGG